MSVYRVYLKGYVIVNADNFGDAAMKAKNDVQHTGLRLEALEELSAEVVEKKEN